MNETTLVIRHRGMAIFWELQTGQKPTLTADGYCFDGQADTQIADVKYQYANSLAAKVYELNIAYSVKEKSFKSK